jgi:hypothetical protein
MAASGSAGLRTVKVIIATSLIKPVRAARAERESADGDHGC